MTFETFKYNVTNWAEERKIYSEGTTEGQIKKLREEAEEVEDAYKNKSVNDLMLEIGDCYVTLHNLCKIAKVLPEGCMEKAWHKIKNRKGEMRNGIFVKEEDLNK
jgi:uncharacterized protein YabN with tetrapyrrole methylase and pyrophosphatase domain